MHVVDSSLGLILARRRRPMSGARCMQPRGGPVKCRHCGGPASILLLGQAADVSRADAVQLIHLAVPAKLFPTRGTCDSFLNTNQLSLTSEGCGNFRDLPWLHLDSKHLARSAVARRTIPSL